MVLNQLPYNEQILYKTFYTQGHPQIINLSKTFSSGDKKDQYFFKIYTLDNNSNLISEGYIYFYLNFLEKTSRFIGVFIKPEFRNQGLSSLLISCWIEFCLDNNFEILMTNRKQRKPFLLYQLKKFYFELENPFLYEQSSKVISIYQKEGDNQKYLFFKDPKQKEIFMKSNIFWEDNYRILHSISNDTQELDKVICSIPYTMQDNENAYKRARTIQQNHNNI